MNTLPSSISLTFILVTLITLIGFYFATKRNILVSSILLALALIQGILAINHFFLDTSATPPRLLLAAAPAVILMILAFATKKGRAFMDTIDLETYTWLHSIRVVVEIVLLNLYLHQLVPQSMTFEGHNFDILSGLTAPLAAYFGFKRKTLDKGVLIAWNIICLALVLQVMITGILSIPSPVQQLSFDQPNKAVLYFPFIWLPGIVVPVVIFGHLVALRRLLK